MKSPSARAEGRPSTHGPASSVMPRSSTHGPASSGPNPLEALGSGRLTGGVGPGPKVPTMPPFSLPGREIISDWEKE